MQITEITIHPTNEDLVKAYVSIVFDNCFMVGEIRVMQGPTGLFVSFPAKKQRDVTHRDIAFPAGTETRRMIEQAILAEYRRSLLKAIYCEAPAQESKHQAVTTESLRKIKFRLRCQFTPDSLLNKVNP